MGFEVNTYFNVKDDCEAKLWDGSKIVFSKSEGANRGFLIYQMDTLNHGEAKEEGKKRIDAFLSYLMIASNVDNIEPTLFTESPKLLNSGKIKGMTMTITRTFTANTILVANFQKQWVEDANVLSSKIHKLTNNEQSAIGRCLFWLRKGAEATPNERFIYRWISLEALSGVLERQSDSTGRWVNLLINRLRNESAKTVFERNEKLFEQLVVASLIGWKNQRRSDELKQAISALEKNGDYKSVMMKMALCIYEVRNKFLHRGEAMSLINDCNTLLRELIHALLKDLVQNI